VNLDVPEHCQDGHDEDSAGQPGYETDLLYLAAIFAIVLAGSGRLALDRLLLRHFGVTEQAELPIE
jgi:uncharacterized membrane protein YphA (DoxX/SURF4 family)